MSDMQISLISVALAALIASWLGARCGAVRAKEKITHGDGGNPLMMKRMRAQSNFVEYAPFALALIIVLDLAGQDGLTLTLTALAFMLGRVLHAIGMDADQAAWPRMVGMLLTLPLLLAWAIWALLLAFNVI